MDDNIEPQQTPTPCFAATKLNGSAQFFITEKIRLEIVLSSPGIG
jgi:hypothetical protein